MSALDFLSLSFYVASVAFASIVHEFMHRFFGVRKFFNVIGSILSFLLALLSCYYLFSDRVSAAALSISAAAPSVSIESCLIYLGLLLGWYVLSFYAKPKYDWGSGS